MAYFYKRTIRTIACMILFGVAIPASTVMAQGIGFFKMGWTYAIAFPGSMQAGVDPATGVIPGVRTYRVVSYGGEQWYLLQRIEKKPGNGWGIPLGAPSVWVNLNYALWAQEAR